MTQKIYPVIVLYKCRLSESRTYRTLLKGNCDGDFMVFDNSPAAYVASHSEPLPPKARYIHDPGNSGLPVAYNSGAKAAKELGYPRLLLLDHDTEFPEGAWEEYLTNAEEPATLAPCILTAHGMPFSPSDTTRWFPRAMTPEGGTYPLRKCMAVNSGMCVRTADFLAAGGYSPKVRLDFADWYFQRKLLKVNPEIRVLPFKAIQDFSNDCKDHGKLTLRYRLFLESARGCHYPTGSFAYLQHRYIVLRHTASLCLRTRSLLYAKLYLSDYLLHKDK